MKLGEMQRYHMKTSYPAIERIADSEGLYVLFSDAQAKSLADERRIATLEAELLAERTRRLAAEDIVDRSLAHFPEKKLRALAHGYRTQYPRVGEEQ